MYCHKCGMQNPDEAQRCQVCEAALPDADQQDEAKIFTDLTQYPFRVILASLKNVALPLAIIAAPIVTLVYAFKKLTGSPFFSAIFNSKRPKFQRTNLDEFHRLHRKSFDKYAAYLSQQGFEPLLDFEDLGMIQGNLQRMLVNPQHTVYATLYLTKATGKVTHVSFLAITAQKTYLAVDNTFAVPIHYPRNVIVRHFLGQSLEQTYQHFLELVAERGETPRFLPLKYLLPIGCKVRMYSIEQGLRQGVLSVTGKETPGLATCYHHPSNVAVRVCSSCGTPLCEACYTRYQGRVYCSNCLPETAHVTTPREISVEGGYAGFGVRLLAALFDLALAAVLGVGVYVGAVYGLRRAPMLTASSPLTAPAIAFFVTQLVLVVFAVWYLILSLRRYGCTLGQRVFGLRVVDHDGTPPDTVAAVVRLAYHLLTCIFIFPVIGYLAILFRKTKQGFHDQLAGTFVMTRYPVRKAVLSWGLLLIIAGGSGWYSYHYVTPLLPFVGSMFDPTQFETEIALEPGWVRNFSDPDPGEKVLSFLTREERCIVSTSAGLHAIDIRTGATLWTDETLPNAIIQQAAAAGDDLPLLVFQYWEEKPVLSRLDPASGRVLWQHTLPIEEAQVVFDAQSIVVYTKTWIAEYTINGTLAWQSDDLSGLEYVMLNEGILCAQFSETAATICYRARGTGELLWSWEKSQFTPGYMLQDGYQVVYTPEGDSMLMYLPEQQQLWDTPQPIGYVIAHDDTYLYTSSAAIRREDGRSAFAYPPETHFGCLTDELVVLLNDAPDANELILVAKQSGAEKQRVQGNGWFGVRGLREDEQRLYLAVNRRPAEAQTVAVTSELLVIEKSAFSVQTILIGKNIRSLNFTIFPDEGVVFIPTYQQLGRYLLPKT
jgi:uncharacterized RDD family membrane protein YckC